jgi:DNA-binding transcriptional ArsR family regulator
MSVRPQSRRSAVNERRIGEVFHALADPTRRAVVERLSCGPASTTELARPFKMALPSFAQHLKVLEDAGVVKSRKEGRLRLYQLIPMPLQAAEGWMMTQRTMWEQRLDRLQAYVEGMKSTDQ